MPALIPLLWGVVFLGIAGCGRSLREAGIIALTLVAVWTLVITTVLTQVSALAALPVALAWGLPIVACGLCVGGNRLRAGAARLREIPRAVSSAPELLSAIGISVLLAATAAAALLYPTTNYDSLTYHMPRVFFWYQNHSVAYFATSEPRQLFSSPFVEYGVLQLKILAGGSDRLAGLVQWTSYVGTIAVTSLLAARLGAQRRGQWVAALAAAAVPMAALQASTTQNDLTCALWLLTAVLAMLHYLEVPTRERREGPLCIIWVGAALALAVLSKPTAYVIAFPFIAWFAVIVAKRFGVQRLVFATATALLTFGLLGSAWFIQTSSVLGGDPIGVTAPGNTHILVRDFRPGALTVNAVKNASMQLGTPFDSVNARTTAIISGVLRTFGGNVENPRTKETTTETYRLDPRVINHDIAPAPMIGLLALLSVMVILARWSDTLRITRHYLAISAVSWWTLNALIAWNHYVNRVTLGALMLAVPLVGVAYTLAERAGKKVVTVAFMTMLILAVGWTVFVTAFSSTNRLVSARALGLPIGARDIGYWNVPYDDLMLKVQAAEYEQAFRSVADAVNAENIDRIGLDVRSGDFRIYPLLYLLRDRHFSYVGDTVLPARIPQSTTRPQAVIEVIPVREYDESADSVDSQTLLLPPQRAADVVILVKRSGTR